MAMNYSQEKGETWKTASSYNLSNYLWLILSLAFAAFRNEENGSPDEIYRAYYAKVIEGRSFDEEVKYHANSRRQEIQEILIMRVENSNQSVDMIKAHYLNFTQKLQNAVLSAWKQKRSTVRSQT